ncbi:MULTISPECIES: hypothetical protein [unclassified Kitasatospora]|uniref:hypothetical protein n=1 Tax=unclassified Kitasatospora TaxID=2633591 RepID=UPI0024749BEC|nr:hypothetical protein [Kitasatospora sp. MAP12-44]
MTTYLHADAKARITAQQQSDGCPTLNLAINLGELTVFGPSRDFDGPAAHLAFAEALAGAANQFLDLARKYAEQASAEAPERFIAGPESTSTATATPSL